MRTIYTNTKHPRVVRWSTAILTIIGLICLVLYIVFEATDRESAGLLYPFSFSLIYLAVFTSEYYLSRFTIDTEADTITDSRKKKYPLRISELKSITYKENRKGKFRSLFLHDDGIGFMDIRTTQKNADLMTSQLLSVNSSIEVKHANYI